MNGKLSTYWNKRTKSARLLKTGEMGMMIVGYLFNATFAQ